MMTDWIGRLFVWFTGFEWRLYFVRRGVGLEYSLHNKDPLALLGYLQSRLGEHGEKISDDWKLYLSYYTGGHEQNFQLTKEMFTDETQFQSLIAKCRGLERKVYATGWSPTFVHVPTRKRLPLNGLITNDLEGIRSYLEQKLEDGHSDEVTFSTLTREVFVR